ncbi:hypothetical protein, partial [Pectobacterium carotovorum]|uniref:hypothetical protein n=1 Tax=Pectobacterium carotovorum TaxID=554 RepID=UPI000D94BB9F
MTTGLLTQVVGCNGGAQAQTYFPSIGHCAAAQAPAQAQFPTLSLQCAQVTTGLLTQVVGCNG